MSLKIKILLFPRVYVMPFHVFTRCRFQTLLRKKAAEELKKEQERKAEERKRTIAERCGPPKQLDGINEGNCKIHE